MTEAKKVETPAKPAEAKTDTLDEGLFPEEKTNENAPVKEVEVPLYDANKGLVPRTGGPFFDEEVARTAEINRARIEDRKPDLDNPGPVAGTPLVTKATLLNSRAAIDPHTVASLTTLEVEPVITVTVEDQS